MSSIRDQIPPRKRQRFEAESSDDPCQSQPSKRLKPSISFHSAEFYNSLSKVCLTRRALKEFDRRTGQTNRPRQPPSVCRQTDLEDSWKKQIQRFARHGGPELRDLRGYPAPTDFDLARTMSDSSGSRRTQSTRPTSKTGSGTSGKRSSAYDDNFEQHLIDYNIYPEEYDYPNDRQTPEPNDLEGFHRRLQLPRPSLSPSRFPDSSFRSFKRKNGRVIDEGEVMRDVVPIICGNANVPNKQNLLFTKLNPIANNTIVDAKPDFYDGARLEDIDKQVRRDLGPFIIPTGHRTAPVAPNFFLEAKAPKGGSDVSKRQACYNGALGARAMHKLQSYKQDEPVYDGNPYTITSTYHAGTGTLQMYTTHLTQSTDGTPEYHTTQVRSLALTDTPDGFRQGATVFRDARDWAKEQRDAIILAANERIESADAAPPPFESFEHIDGLDPTGVQDVSHLTQAEDTVYGPRYYKPPQDGHGGFKNDVELQGAANRGTGYLHTDPSTSGSSDYNGSSDTTVPQLVEESQTSIDELALGTYTQPKASNKRRNRPSEKTASKAPRKTDSRSRRRGSRR